jgi:hypothetical protein
MASVAVVTDPHEGHEANPHETQTISLIGEDGRERKFVLHDAFDVDDVTYYLVEAEDDANLVLLLKDSGGGLETVEGEEFDRVIKSAEVDADE